MPSRRSVLASVALSASTALAGCGGFPIRTTPDGESNAGRSPPVRVAADRLLQPINRLAAVWNANRPPHPDEFGTPIREELSNELGVADHFAQRHGFEPTGEAFRPPFRVVTVDGTEYSDGEEFALTDDAVDIGETGVLAVRGGGRTALPDGFVRHDVFRTGAGLFVSEPLADAGVEALAMADVLAMFEGDATNWREFGGPDREIHLLAAPFGNPGSRFQRTVLSGVERDGIDEVADRDGRVKAVASRDDAVARFPFPDIDAIRSNGVGDTYRIDAVVDGARRGPDEVGYPGTWAVPLFTNGDPDPRERAFLDALSHGAVLNWLTARTLDGDVLRTFPVADPPKY